MTDIFDFQNLEVDSQTAWFEMPELSPGARVCVKPATESNKGYYNGLLRRSGVRARRIQRTDKLTAEDADASRSEDRELYPRYVLVNWEGVLDKQNQPVPFTADNNREFCAKLPAWLFDRLRAFAGTPERFLSDSDDPVPDGSELVGN